VSKAAVQAAIFAGMAGYVSSHRRELRLDRPVEVARYLRDLIAVASGPTELKYVRFGRQVFLDGWTPPWPSPWFDRVMSALPAMVNSQDPAWPGSCFYVVVSITSRCMFRCAHCYTSHTLERKDRLPREVLLDTVDRMLERGVGILSLEGGEPLLRFDDLLALLELARGRTSPYIATTGFGLTADKARRLAAAGLVGAQISLDHWDAEVHNAQRRSSKAFDAAVDAVGIFRRVGVMPIISMVPTPQMVDQGGLYRFLDFAREIGAGMIQMIDPMPAGENADDHPGSSIMSADQRQALYDFHVEANTDPRWADHPNVSARLYTESELSLGCGWGGTGIYYLDSFGNLEPCPYANLVVGNVMDEDFDLVWTRMRQLFPRPVGGLCPAYQLGREEAKARAAGQALPLPLDQTKALAATFAQRPLPRQLASIDRRKS
jgi:MoaA/NifB/PqqE/SkfB family radical SAM enzyme